MKIEIYFENCTMDSIDNFMDMRKQRSGDSLSKIHPQNIFLAKAVDIAWVLRVKEEELGEFLRTMADCYNGNLYYCIPDQTIANDTVICVDDLFNITAWYSAMMGRDVVCRSLHNEGCAPIGVENIQLLTRTDGAVYTPEMGKVEYIESKGRYGYWWETYTEYENRRD